MGILSLSTLCLTGSKFRVQPISIFLSITMNKVTLLCLILAVATTTYGDCYKDCFDATNTCLKECPVSQECQDYIDIPYNENLDYVNWKNIYVEYYRHPCGKCGDECVVDDRACMHKCDEMEGFQPAGKM